MTTEDGIELQTSENPIHPEKEGGGGGEDEGHEIATANGSKMAIEWLKNNTVEESKYGSDIWFNCFGKEPTDDEERMCQESDSFLNKSGSLKFTFKYDSSIRTLHIVNDWISLWNSMIDNDCNFIAEEAPLLFAGIQFFLHPFVLAFTLTMEVYFIIIQIVANCLWPDVMVTTFIYANSGMIIALVIGAIVIKGSLWGHLKEEKIDRKRRATNASDKPMIQRPELRSSNSIVAAVLQTVQLNLLLMLNFRSRVKKRTRKTGEIKVRGFYEIIEAATEYLSSLGDREDKFKPRPYTNMMLMLFYLGVPTYYTVNLIVEWVALANTCRHQPGYKTLDNVCNAMHFQATMYGAYLVNNIMYAMVFMSAGTVLTVLLYGCDVANALTIYWMLRFQPLRSMNAQHFDVVNHSNARVSKTDKCDLGIMVPLIERDAYERYLLVQNYMHEASIMWGPLLTIILLVCFGTAADCYYTSLFLYAKYQEYDLTIVLVGVFAVLCMFFVIYCIAYANGAVDSILRGFLYSAKYDYHILGQRDTWISYVGEAPIYWYIFGFAVTRTWLLSFVGGGVSAVVGGIIMSYAVGG